VKKLIKLNNYILDYFGYNVLQFNKLLKLVNLLKGSKYKWQFFQIAIIVYLLPKFTLFKLKLYFYTKPKWFVKGLRNKFRRTTNSYKGYSSYSEYDKERQIDWGADMYR